MDLEKIYRNRFENESDKKRNLWAVLCGGFFSKYIKPNDVVLDVAAGYCDFVNNVCAKRRIAVDLNPDISLHAGEGVETHVCAAQSLDFLEDGVVDVAFVSNFFEHIEKKDDIIRILREINRVLKPESGLLLILQPNNKYLAGDYWDFFDHVTPLTHKSMLEAIKLAGNYRVVKLIRRFLPYTTKSALPQSPFFVKAYLKFPLAWRILGKQMFIVAEKQAKETADA